MKITVFGANGDTGAEIVKAAVAHNYQVVCAVRRPETITTDENIKVKKISFDDAASIKEAISGSDVVVSAIGTGGLKAARATTYLYSTATRAIIAGMRECNVKRLFVLSSGGVEEEAEAPWFYNAIIRRFVMNTYLDMTRMETILEENGDIEWTSVRLTYLQKGGSKPYLVKNRVLGAGNFKINCVDAAEFIVKDIEERKWIRMFPVLGYP